MPRPHHDIGADVFAALTDDDKAELARRIRVARASYYGAQDDDWLCCVLQNRIDLRGLGEREDEVTHEDLLGTCADIGLLFNAGDGYRALGAFGIHRDRVGRLYAAAAAVQSPELDYDAIGRRVYAGLTSRDRATMKRALRICRDDPDGEDDFHCALGNLGYGNPIAEGRRVRDKDVLELCQVLAELHDVVRDDPRRDYELDWERLLGGGFGPEHVARLRGLFADAGTPLFERRVEKGGTVESDRST